MTGTHLATLGLLALLATGSAFGLTGGPYFELFFAGSSSQIFAVTSAKLKTIILGPTANSNSAESMLVRARRR